MRQKEEAEEGYHADDCHQGLGCSEGAGTLFVEKTFGKHLLPIYTHGSDIREVTPC